MNLPYFAADTLGVTLHAVRAGLVANEVHEMGWGPWRIELPIDVTSDVMSGHEVGLWVTLAKTLRIYLIIRDKESWLLVLNEQALRECGERTGFASRTVKERILEIKPAVKGVFHWKGSDWKKVQYDVTTVGG